MPGRAALLTVEPVSHNLVSAMALLPEPYAQAVRLQLDGASPDDVAAALHLDRAAVSPLLQVADAKLRELLLDGAEDAEAAQHDAPTTHQRNQP